MAQDTTKIIKKRLRLKKRKGARTTIDRWLNFVVGDLDPKTELGLRGTVFRVEDKWEALHLCRQLREMAKNARAEGREAEFLDALDSRSEDAAETEDAMTLKEWAEWWFENCVKHSDQFERSIETDRQRLDGHLIPFFGDRQLTDIDECLIDDFIILKRRQQRPDGKQGYASSYINDMVSVLRRCLRVAVRRNHLKANPAETGDFYQKKPTTAEDSSNWLEPCEERQLIRWLWETWKDEPVKWLSLLTMLVTGVRYSEDRAFLGKDLVKGPEPGIWVRRKIAGKKVEAPKARRVRFHNLPPEVVNVLLPLVDGPEQPLFRPPRATNLAKTSLNRWLRKACEAAGVRVVSIHGLRHTASSSYVAAGYSQKEIAEIIGHVDSRSTERYVHVASKIKKQAVERRWEEAMKEEPSGPKPTPDGSGIISLDQFRSRRREHNAAS